MGTRADLAQDNVRPAADRSHGEIDRKFGGNENQCGTFVERPAVISTASQLSKVLPEIARMIGSPSIPKRTVSIVIAKSSVSFRSVRRRAIT